MTLSLETSITAAKSERFHQRRAALTARMLDHLLTPEGQDESFRGLAAAAGVTRPTLVHYFGDHAGVLKACIELAGQRGRVYSDLVATGPDEPPQTFLPATFLMMHRGWDYGLGRLHRLGMLAGLSDPELGKVYTGAIFEPTMTAFESRLARYQAQGMLSLTDLRADTISLVTPVLMTFMAQHLLHGDQTRPLNIKDFVEKHVESWIRAHRP